MADFAKVIYPVHYLEARKKLNKVMGIAPEAEQTNLQMQVGESGVSHALVMLVHALEEAKPGDKILVVSYGSGCDALCFEVTREIEKKRDRRGISTALARRADLDNYTKLLVWRNILPADFGKRREEDHWTRFSAMWRIRKLVLGLYDGKCTECGTAQIPAQDICVNPECGAVGTLEPYRFSDKLGHIASFTGDNLAASLDPPAIYGQVPCQVDGGLKCFGHPIGASGLRMIYAMYEQLLDRVPQERKVKNPRLGLTYNHGGIPSRNVCAISIIGKN